MRTNSNKEQRAAWGNPKRSADMWLRDLLDSVRVLSQPRDAQNAILQNWQVKTGDLTERFQFEWSQFKRLHRRALPLNVSERLGWLAQLTFALPPDSDLGSHAWDEIRQVAADALRMTDKW